jgi:uncharacterized protein YijF (DUF1287 family)
MSEIDEMQVIAGARELCAQFGCKYDDLPEIATYIQRKSATLPILDRQEARSIADAILWRVATGSASRVGRSIRITSTEVAHSQHERYYGSDFD